MSNEFHPNRGAALVTALAVLFICGLLVTGYFGFMYTEAAEMDFDLSVVRAGHYAHSGVWAAVGALERALESGEYLTGTVDYEFPEYRAEDDGLVVHEIRGGFANVEIVDESAKLNVNHAVPAALQRIGFSADSASKVAASLPMPGGTAHKRWLVSLNDLTDRGLVPPEELPDERREMLTVYSAPAHDRTAGIVNVNRAPAPVIAAVFGIDTDAAEQLVEARPFADADELRRAANALPGDAASNRTFRSIPTEVGFESRCFRIRCTGIYSDNLSAAARENEAPSGATARVEAVVYFPEGAAPRVMYWSEDS